MARFDTGRHADPATTEARPDRENTEEFFLRDLPASCSLRGLPIERH